MEKGRGSGVRLQQSCTKMAMPTNVLAFSILSSNPLNLSFHQASQWCLKWKIGFWEINIILWFINTKMLKVTHEHIGGDKKTDHHVWNKKPDTKHFIHITWWNVNIRRIFI